MALKVIADLGTLFRLASDVGKARMRGAPQEEIDKLEKRHKEYEKICLMADELSTGMTTSQLFGGHR